MKLIKIITESDSRASVDELLKKAHFAKTDQELDKIKILLKKETGWDDDDVEYELQRFKKANKNMVDPSFKQAGMSVSNIKWNNSTYQKWLKQQTGNTGIENSSDMARNAKNEPGLIDYVRNVIKGEGGDESPLERIQ